MNFLTLPTLFDVDVITGWPLIQHLSSSRFTTFAIINHRPAALNFAIFRENNLKFESIATCPSALATSRFPT